MYLYTARARTFERRKAEFTDSALVFFNHSKYVMTLTNSMLTKWRRDFGCPQSNPVTCRLFLQSPATKVAHSTRSLAITWARNRATCIFRLESSSWRPHRDSEADEWFTSKRREKEFRPFHFPTWKSKLVLPRIFFSLSKRSKLGEKLDRLKDRATFRPNTASFIEASRKMTSLASNFMPDGRTAMLPRIFWDGGLFPGYPISLTWYFHMTP